MIYSFKAKLHKVEINKPGGHFIKHRESDKDKSIFGTLIIQPPSSHTGGELVVYEANGKSKKVIDFGQKEKKSKFSVQFTAHNADLQHELLEVKSGYRLTLVYSLYLIRGYLNILIFDVNYLLVFTTCLSFLRKRTTHQSYGKFIGE